MRKIVIRRSTLRGLNLCCVQTKNRYQVLTSDTDEAEADGHNHHDAPFDYTIGDAIEIAMNKPRVKKSRSKAAKKRPGDGCGKDITWKFESAGALISKLKTNEWERQLRPGMLLVAINDRPVAGLATKDILKIGKNEDGTKAFHPADFANVQNELPENVLNEIELFLFGVNQNATIDNVKES